MNEGLVEAAALHEGVNDPSPIKRVLMLGYYDGPLDGVLQIGDSGPVYRFAMLQESRDSGPPDCALRVYGLYPLPADALKNLTDLLAPSHAPRWPNWCPVWQFRDESEREFVERQTKAVLNSSGPLSWILVGDICSSAVRALLVQLARAS